MTRLRFVALDLGNVLCDLHPHAFQQELARRLGLAAQQVDEVFDETMWHRMETGHATPAQFRSAILGRLGVALADADFDECWNLLPTPRPGADALVARLRLPHAIWSNTDPIHSANLAAGMAAIRGALHLHFSFTAGCRKPDPEYYRRGLSALGAAAQEVLFVDDRDDNVATARALGIWVEQVRSLRELETALLRHGALST